MPAQSPLVFNLGTLRAGTVLLCNMSWKAQFAAATDAVTAGLPKCFHTPLKIIMVFLLTSSVPFRQAALLLHINQLSFLPRCRSVLPDHVFGHSKQSCYRNSPCYLYAQEPCHPRVAHSSQTLQPQQRGDHFPSPSGIPDTYLSFPAPIINPECSLPHHPPPSHPASTTGYQAVSSA
jgi:hypothetical protein